MNPKLPFPPLPEGILIEKVDTIPEAALTRGDRASQHDWLYKRMDAMKPGDQPIRLTLPNKKNIERYRGIANAYKVKHTKRPDARKSWKTYAMSTNGNNPEKPYYLYIDCVVFDPQP